MRGCSVLGLLGSQRLQCGAYTRLDLLLHQRCNALGQRLFREVAKDAHVRARFDGSLCSGHHVVGLGRGSPGICSGLRLGLQIGQLLLGGFCLGFPVLFALSVLHQRFVGDGVLAITRHHHGVGGISRFGRGASVLAGGCFVRHSGGIGRATVVQLCTGIALASSQSCGGLFRAQCALDGCVIESHVLSPAFPPHIAVAARGSNQVRAVARSVCSLFRSVKALSGFASRARCLWASLKKNAGFAKPYAGRA